MIIDSNGNKSITIGRDSLNSLWNELIVVGGYDEVAFDDFQRAVYETLSVQNGTVAREAGWHFNPIGWEIRVSEGLFKSAVVTVLLTIVLKSLNQTNIPLGVLVAIVPLFFEVRKVSLSDRERTIYLDLIKNPMASIHANSPDVLYRDYLTEEMQAELNMLDFVDFLEKLSKIGLSEKIVGGKLLIKSEKKFHLHFRFS